jgi:transcriptional regulator with XRE-family HTH domain
MVKSLQLQIAKRIREILDKKGWKQQRLADESGLTKAYVSKIMSGSLNLTLDTVKTLERALKEKIIEVK